MLLHEVCSVLLRLIALKTTNLIGGDFPIANQIFPLKCFLNLTVTAKKNPRCERA